MRDNGARLRRLEERLLPRVCPKCGGCPLKVSDADPAACPECGREALTFTFVEIAGVTLEDVLARPRVVYREPED